MTRWLRFPVLALAVLVLGGCQEILGTDRGKSIEVYMVGGGTPELEGLIDLHVHVVLTTPAGEEVMLTNGSILHLMRIEDPDSSFLVERRVQSVEYDRIQLVFTRVEVDVERGLLVGSPPVPVLGRVEVPLTPPESVVAERQVDLNLPARRREILVIDLNAGTWLPAVQLPARTVPPATFENAVSVRVR